MTAVIPAWNLRPDGPVRYIARGNRSDCTNNKRENAPERQSTHGDLVSRGTRANDKNSGDHDETDAKRPESKQEGPPRQFLANIAVLRPR